MIISFANLDHAIAIDDGGPSVLRIENPSLFARVCQSLISGGEEDAIEPYSVWGSDGGRLKTAEAMILVTSPFVLPWEHRSLQGGLHKMMLALAKSDGDLLSASQELVERHKSLFASLAYQLDGDYGFALEWNIDGLLKAFRFGVSVREDASLLEKLISFVDLAGDMKVKEALVFVNLKTFLSKSDMLCLYERLFFHRIGALLLENQASPIHHEIEREYVVDVDFIEYEVSVQKECLSSPQGRICSDGFGAVAF